MEKASVEPSTSRLDEGAAARIRAKVETLYRTESRRVFATLIRRLGDFDLAEEAAHDAFRAALEQWPRDGEPANPRAWLTSVGRFKGIDRIRRRARFDPLDDDAGPATDPGEAAEEQDNGDVEDNLLRLIFICCHPALAPDAQVALMLLEDQDRSLWNRKQIGEGLALVKQALASHRFGPYTLQAAIAAVHAEGAGVAGTDWPRIVALLVRGELADYHLAHAARADMCRRLGHTSRARAAYQRALTLSRQPSERRFLERRLQELPAG